MTLYSFMYIRLKVWKLHYTIVNMMLKSDSIFSF